MIRHGLTLVLLGLGLVGCTGGAATRPAVATFSLSRLEPVAVEAPTVPVMPDVAAPEKTAPPSKEPGGPGGGGSGASLRGRVLAFTGEGEAPIAGAIVRTGDGRTAETDTHGEFTLSGAFPPNGTLVASHPRYVASAVTGLVAGQAIALHLRPRATNGADIGMSLVRRAARGRVVDPDGRPVGGIAVSLEDGRGSYSVPAVSNEGGVFKLTVFAVDGRVEDGILLAASVAEEPAWLGVASGVGLTAGGEIDPMPDQAGNEALSLVAADHSVLVALDGAEGANATLVLEGPQGTSLSLPIRGGVGHIAKLPGVHYALKAQALDAAAGTASRLFQDDLTIDFNQPTTTVAATLLAPPRFETTPTLASGAPIRWVAADGVRGYRLTLAGLEGQGFLWEGFATSDPLSFSYSGPPLSGRYGLTLSAWDEADMSPRTVAAVGRRALRQLPLGRSYRMAEQRVVLTF